MVLFAYVMNFETSVLNWDSLTPILKFLNILLHISVLYLIFNVL